MITEEDVLTKDFSELWNVFKRLLGTFSEGKKNETYNMVRYGINVKFDINDYFNENLALKAKKGIVQIGQNTLKSKDLYTEIELRERELAEFLLINLKDESIFGEDMERE